MKRDAARILNVAEKTIERLAKRGDIQQATRKRPGAASVVVFHPGDIEKVRQEQEAAAKPGAFLVPAEKGGSVELTQQSRVSPLDQLVTLLQRPASSVALTDKLYLTLKEAAALSGLPVSYIQAAMKEGKITAIKTGAGWRIKRETLMSL